MNRAVQLVSSELNIDVKEFTVAGIRYENMFAHHWFIGTDDQVDPEILRRRIDETLMELNDDYKVERISALKNVIVDVVPSHFFYDFLQEKGKAGNSFKFPRVLKSNMLAEWENFLRSHSKQDI
jgi:hypothetical protein